MNVNKLRGLMAENNISRKYLAKKLGISVTSITNKLNGHTPFKIAEIQKVSEIFNVDINIFFK